MMEPALDTLPPPQRQLWHELHATPAQQIRERLTRAAGEVDIAKVKALPSIPDILPTGAPGPKMISNWR